MKEIIKHILFEYIYFLNSKSKFEDMQVEIYGKNGKLLAIQDMNQRIFKKR